MKIRGSSKGRTSRSERENWGSNPCPRAVKSKAESIGTEKVRWDLSVMYSGIDDPELDRDISKLLESYKKFNKNHKGKLAKTLGKAISDYCELEMLENKISVFLYLLKSVNVDDAAIKAKVADANKKISLAFGEYMAFFQIELVALKETILAKFYKSDSVVKKHRPWIEYSKIFKPHLLSESVEGALAKRLPFGPVAWGEFFDELESDLEFEFKGEKKNVSEILHILTDSKNPDERSEVMKVINSTLYGPFAKYSAQTLYMVTGSRGVENEERSYRHPMDLRNKANRIPDKVVDILHKVVKEVAGSLARRYYKLKARHLGLKTLRWSDRNAPMPFADTSVIPFDEAIKIVLDSYESFSPVLASLIKNLIKSKRIDAPVKKNKISGAYNYSVVLPGYKPASFVFLNYLGSARDVMTYAHELGHAVHGLLAGEAQGPLMFGAPTAYAETASVFGEKTTFNFLKKKLREEGDDKSLLAMIMSKIDDAINKIVRQIGFSNFERRLHGMNSSYTKWEEPKKHSVEEIDKIWLETLKEFYGRDGEIFTYENAEHLWSYVGHFHRPFYVYGYAFGQLLTESLYAQQERFGDKFEPLYLDLLRSGSTKDVVELLKPFGLDPTKEKFWIEGVNVGLGVMIKEAEELSRRVLKKSTK